MLLKQEAAARIKEASNAADRLMEAFLESGSFDRKELEETLKRYIGCKLQLAKEEISDNITVMVRTSVSKATGIPAEKLKELDRPGRCGSAPTVLAKRVLLFVDIQKKTGVTIPPDRAPDIQTVEDLSEILYPALSHRMTGS